MTCDMCFPPQWLPARLPANGLPPAPWVGKGLLTKYPAIGSDARAHRGGTDGRLFSQHRHIEAEEFKCRLAVDPAVQRVRLEDDHVIRLVGDFADLVSTLAVQGQFAGAR